MYFRHEISLEKFLTLTLELPEYDVQSYKLNTFVRFKSLKEQNSYQQYFWRFSSKSSDQPAKRVGRYIHVWIENDTYDQVFVGST
jgi:hypothetical protein